MITHSAIKTDRNQLFDSVFPHAIRYDPPSPDGTYVACAKPIAQRRSHGIFGAEQPRTVQGLEAVVIDLNHARQEQVAPSVGQLIGNAKALEVKYLNRNGLIEDSMKLHLELEHLNTWTEQEQDIFFARHVLLCITKIFS